VAERARALNPRRGRSRLPRAATTEDHPGNGVGPSGPEPQDSEKEHPEWWYRPQQRMSVAVGPADDHRARGDTGAKDRSGPSGEPTGSGHARSRAGVTATELPDSGNSGRGGLAAVGGGDGVRGRGESAARGSQGHQNGGHGQHDVVERDACGGRRPPAGAGQHGVTSGRRGSPRYPGTPLPGQCSVSCPRRPLTTSDDAVFGRISVRPTRRQRSSLLGSSPVGREQDQRSPPRPDRVGDGVHVLHGERRTGGVRFLAGAAQHAGIAPDLVLGVCGGADRLEQPVGLRRGAGPGPDGPASRRCQARTVGVSRRRSSMPPRNGRMWLASSPA
jgi:hypothetical protein